MASNPVEISFAEANDNGAYYRDQPVKVCGHASNQFEDLKITEKLGDHYTKRGIILGVYWLKKEPYTNGPEKRCVTGKLLPKGGWENYARKAAGEPHDVILGGGSTGADWVIRQITLARD